MKRIFSSLFAIIALVGTTGIFTACQEDAPEINYTINVTVNNDFTEVVNAINNGTMKQEAAIAALTAAIEKMQGDQNAKLDAIVEAINTLATTLDAKLAIIEAAMKAQTLALETKLGLIEAAIKALPDYTDQLKAIEAAIKGLPDYSDKLAAIETALEAIAANIEAQEGQYADELAALTEAIDAITAAVEAGNKSQADALAEIIALLESGAIAGGGSGSGGEGGEGGEGSGGEDEDPYITFKTDRETNLDVRVTPCEIKTAEGVELLPGYPYTIEDRGYTVYSYDLISNPVKLTFNGNPIVLDLYWLKITEIDLSKLTALEEIHLQKCKLTKVDFSHNKNIKRIYLYNSDERKCNYLTSETMTDVVASLPDRTGKEAGDFKIGYTEEGYDCPILPADVAIAEGKNWVLL
ncbi:MAG: hypothetical protein E7145_03315 [Rikenellaceae bacterium]|nr:hypothetical protein [Rikenellaceae bacterium]